jgi:hypothetical protein
MVFDRVENLWIGGRGRDCCVKREQAPLKCSLPTSAILRARLGSAFRAYGMLKVLKRDRSPSGHGGAVYSAAFSRDGDRVITASDDATAHLWEASTREIAAFSSPKSEPPGPSLYPDDTISIQPVFNYPALSYDTRLSRRTCEGPCPGRFSSVTAATIADIRLA